MKNPIVERVAQLIRPEIRALSAYHVPDAAGLVKLDAMENPYPWPPALVTAWLEHLRHAALNRYPDPAAHALQARLRATMDLPHDSALLLGNGSDELIQLIALAVAGAERVVLTPEPGFAMYRLIAAACGMRYLGVPLAADFSLDVPAMLAAIEQYRPAVIFLAYPNNPTGNLFDEHALQTLIEAAPGLVVVDEAYHVFARKSFIDKLARHPNLLILRTLSKMGLAGLRLGLLIGDPAWLTQLDKVRLPYNINVLTQLSADFALAHQQVFDEQARRICTDREKLFADLCGHGELRVYPSQANFILFRAPAGRATTIFEALKDAGILIKNLHAQGGLLQDCLRVTVGTPAENQAFLSALKNAL